MSRFLDQNFLLLNNSSRTLYHDYCSFLPLVDFHCHLSARQIAENQSFENITEAWLGGDHYKWRAMRANGVAEEFISGSASPEEKFKCWASTVPQTIRNPLYHWTHLELQRYFGIDRLLDENSATQIYRTCNDKLLEPGLRPLGILKAMKVETLCTTDDPLDDLSWHRKIPLEFSATRVLPGFRPDLALGVQDPKAYGRYLDQLGEVAGQDIRNYADLLTALRERVKFFHAEGCRISDHGLEQMPARGSGSFNPEKAFLQVRAAKELGQEESASLKFSILRELCLLYDQFGWVQQFHLGALRDNNSRIASSLGINAGTDSMGDFPQARNLSQFLNSLDKENRLAKTILYNVNPSDNATFATMASNFNDGTVAGKVQWGPAWWFLDQRNGIEAQLDSLSSFGLLSRFVGMVTDSRSFLSYPRHEYFRRILCNLIGADMEMGLLPADIAQIGKICADISYHNARAYFNFP